VTFQRASIVDFEGALRLSRKSGSKLRTSSQGHSFLMKGASMSCAIPFSIFLFAVPLFSQPQRTINSGSVSGVVLDDEGRLISGATVYALPEKDMRKQLQTTTDQRGRFLLEAVPAGGVYVDAYKESEGLPYNFFAFFKTTDRTPVKVDVQEGSATTGVVIQVGPKAGYLTLGIMDQDGMMLEQEATLVFTRDDMPGPYKQGVKLPHSMLVPSVPFRFSIEVDGFESWSSEIIRLRPAEVLNMVVTLKRR